MAIKIKCDYCGKKIIYGESCSCDGKKQARAKQQKYYNKNNRSRNSEKFYYSTRWRKTREQCKLRYYGLDLYELYKYGNISQGSLSHHIIEFTEDPERIYDIENLIYLSKSNHNEIHNAYNESPKAKKEMQDYLFSIIKRFKQDY